MKTHKVEVQKVGETRKPGRSPLPVFLRLLATFVAGAFVVLPIIYAIQIRLAALPPAVPEMLIVTVEVTPHPTAGPTPTPTPTATPEPAEAVLIGSVWLRQTASVTSRRVVALRRGDAVVVLAVEGERCKVRWRGEEAEVEGWVAARWVKVQ